MKKVKAMSNVKTPNQEPTKETETKKTHVALVKPTEAARPGDPGVGCRPTGVQ